MYSRHIRIVRMVWPTVAILATTSLSVHAVSPPSLVITPDSVTINQVVITPTLSKNLFIEALGKPSKIKQGVEGTARGDGYWYDSLGLFFRTNAGQDTVTDITFSRSKGQYSPQELFEGTLIVFGQKLPLDKVQNIKQAVPGLELERKYHQYSPVFGANIGKWSLSIRGIHLTQPATIYCGFTIES